MTRINQEGNVLIIETDGSVIRSTKKFSVKAIDRLSSDEKNVSINKNYNLVELN